MGQWLQGERKTKLGHFDLYSMHCEVQYFITVLPLPLGLETYLLFCYGLTLCLLNIFWIIIHVCRLIYHSICLYLCRCWELSAGNIKWIYQVPILTAIGVSKSDVKNCQALNKHGVRTKRQPGKQFKDWGNFPWGGRNHLTLPKLFYFLSFTTARWKALWQRRQMSEELARTLP